MFIKYEAEVSSRVGGGERGVVDFGKLFTETNEQKFSLGGVCQYFLVSTSSSVLIAVILMGLWHHILYRVIRVSNTDCMRPPAFRSRTLPTEFTVGLLIPATSKLSHFRLTTNLLSLRLQSKYTNRRKEYKKLSYRRGTARCVVSVEILPITTQQCRNYLYDKS